MVGRLVSFWESLFSGAFAVSFREGAVKNMAEQKSGNFYRCCESEVLSRSEKKVAVAPGYSKKLGVFAIF